MNVSQSARLPIELYRNIVNQIDERRDLYHLLFVSRAFHAEAERILYNDVNCDGDPRPLEHIIRSPHVACLVASLKLATEYPADPVLLNAALRATTNLRSLELTGIAWSSEERGLDKLVRGVVFQLQRLVLRIPSTTSDVESMPFFVSQSASLEELDITHGQLRCVKMLSGISFANLRRLGCLRSNWELAAVLKHGQITNLRCPSSLIDLVGQELHSVRALSIVYWEHGENWVQNCPNLTYLRIEVVSPNSVIINWAIDRLTGCHRTITRHHHGLTALNSTRRRYWL